MEELIAAEDVVVTVSHEGYIKRLPVDTYRAQGRGGRGIKGTESREGDFVEHLFVANTHDYLLFFTNQGRVYERRVYDVPEMSRTSQGRAIANLLEFQAGEKIANVLAIKDFGKAEQFLMFATAKGTVKKTAFSAYANIRTNGIIAIGLEEGDSLIGVEMHQRQGPHHPRHQERPGDSLRRSRRPRDGPPRRRRHRRTLQARRRRSRRHARRPRRRQRRLQAAHRLRQRLRQAHAA